jgi:hypothetical protein
MRSSGSAALRPHRIVRRGIGGLVAAMVVLALAACSSGSGPAANGPSTIGPQSTLPESSGYRCVDPKGDVGSAIKGVGTLSEPAGIDILVAEAKVDGDSLVVTYQMAGDANTPPSPFVSMLQGDVSAPAYSFELRAEPIAGAAPGDPWGLTLVTFKDAEKRVGLNTAVTATGNTITYRVPLTTIPPIATLQWTFGASSTSANNNVLFDDCNSFTNPDTPATVADAPGLSVPAKGPTVPDTNP